MNQTKYLRITTDAKRFFHGSLSSVQAWLDDEIAVYEKEDLEPGWKDRVVAATLILACRNEAFFNAVGVLKISEWDFRATQASKLRVIRKNFTPDVQANQEPFKSVDELRILRNDMVHALPEIVDGETDIFELAKSEDERDIFARMDHSVEARISLKSYIRFRDNSRKYMQLVQEEAELSDWDLSSSVSQSETVIPK